MVLSKVSLFIRLILIVSHDEGETQFFFSSFCVVLAVRFMLNISDNNDYIVFYVKFWFNRKPPFIFYDTLTKWTSSYRKHIQATILFYLKLLFFFFEQMEKENSNRKSNERRVGWIYIRITLYVIRMTHFYFSLIHFYMKRNIVAVKFYLQQKNAFILSINKKKVMIKFCHIFHIFFAAKVFSMTVEDLQHPFYLNRTNVLVHAFASQRFWIE